MTRPHLTAIAPAISQLDIAQAERALGTSLPADYRAFLLEHNGGTPEPATFHRDDLPSKEAIAWFFALKNAEDGLLQLAQLYQGHVHRDLLPIASDPFGNLVCIRTRGETVGAIYFWLHETDMPASAPLPHSGCQKISIDFDHFLDRFDPPTTRAHHAAQPKDS